MLEYLTHDNGGNPFKVVIHIDDGDYKVEIFKLDDIIRVDGKFVNKYFDKPIHVFYPKTIFVGKSEENSTTLYSGAFGPKYDGNSILLDMDSNTYIYVGERIFEFRTLSEIDRYSSPIGNSDVPYPYAVDRDGRYYLMIENVIVENVPDDYDDDPYSYYYYYGLMTPDKAMHPPSLPKVDTGIDSFYIGDEEYTLRYHPDPDSDYERISEWEDFGEGFSIVKRNKSNKKSKRKLTKRSYKKMMKDFGKLLGFHKLNIDHVYQERSF